MFAIIAVSVLALFFIFVCYMAAKTWRIPHVLLLFGIFLFTLVFMFLAASSLKTRQVWKKQYQDLTAQLDAETRRLNLLEHGDLLAPGDAADNLPTLQGEFERLIIDRGRVWRNVIPGPAEAGIGLNFANWGDDDCYRSADDVADQPLGSEPEDGSGTPTPTAAPTHGMTEGMILYGFLDASVGEMAQQNPPLAKALLGESELLSIDTKGRCRVPVYYLGSFRVAKVDGDNVTVVPSLPLDAQQMQAIGQAQPWSLYEVMPIDSHEAMAGMSEEAIRSLFTNNPAIAEDYVRDLSAARAGDPDDRTMRKVKFTRDFEIEVDVDGEEPGIERNFDPSGRAIIAQLRQGEPTKFKAGDSPDVYFRTDTANSFRRDGIAEFEDAQPIFVRPLRDYAYYYYQKNVQMEDLLALMEVLKRENASLTATAERAREQINYREDELKKLAADQDKVDEELRLLESYQAKLQQLRQQQQSSLSSYYHWNLQLADELRGSVFYGAGN